MLSGLLYFSLAHPELKGEQVSEIVRVACDTNASNNITSRLHVEDGLFLQWVEGPEDEVTRLWSGLAEDRRHRNVTRVFGSALGARRFPDWHMKLTGKSQACLTDYVRSRGICLLDWNPCTASQLLEFLHQAARDSEDPGQRYLGSGGSAWFASTRSSRIASDRQMDRLAKPTRAAAKVAHQTPGTDMTSAA